MVALPILPDPNSFNYGGARGLMWRLQLGDPLRQVAVLGDEDDNEDDEEEELGDEEEDGDDEQEWSATQAALQDEYNKLMDAEESKKPDIDISDFKPAAPTWVLDCAQINPCVGRPMAWRSTRSPIQHEAP